MDFDDNILFMDVCGKVVFSLGYGLDVGVYGVEGEDG